MCGNSDMSSETVVSEHDISTESFGEGGSEQVSYRDFIPLCPDVFLFMTISHLTFEESIGETRIGRPICINFSKLS